MAEKLAAHRRGIEEMTLQDGVVIGLCQTVALIPGSSRSGTTITGGLALGLKREDAARFSFLLSIPANTAAGVFQLKQIIKDPHRPSTVLLAVGTDDVLAQKKDKKGAPKEENFTADPTDYKKIQNARELAGKMTVVTEAIDRTSRSAMAVHETSQSFSSQASTLEDAVETFLTRVTAA